MSFFVFFFLTSYAFVFLVFCVWLGNYSSWDSMTGLTTNAPILYFFVFNFCFFFLDVLVMKATPDRIAKMNTSLAIPALVLMEVYAGKEINIPILVIAQVVSIHYYLSWNVCSDNLKTPELGRVETSMYLTNYQLWVHPVRHRRLYMYIYVKTYTL